MSDKAGEAQPASGVPHEYDVRSSGAVGDGRRLDTAAIQSAIDACAGRGGGIVRFGPGLFLTGELQLKSGVAIHLGQGATLLGSTDLAHYPAGRAILSAERQRDIAVVGSGTIDGQGAAFSKDRPRPMNVHFMDCARVRVVGVALRNSAGWMQSYDRCSDLHISGISVWNHSNYNNDGMDCVDCRNVTICDCRISSDDDAICLKSRSPGGCESIVISNCVVASHCSGIKCGTESYGGFRNIAVSNCAVRAPEERRKFYGAPEGASGILLASVDGAELEGIALSNIVIRDSRTPIFLNLGCRGAAYGNPQPRGAGTFRNVALSNILAEGTGLVGNPICGLPGRPIEGVSLRDVCIRSLGGELPANEPSVENWRNGRPVPENEKEYPHPLNKFGYLPAYGLFCRHVRGLRLNGVVLESARPETRPATLFEDVAELEVRGGNINKD